MKKAIFSIVIPVAPGRNIEVLESISKLDFPKNKYEVIVERGNNTSDNRNRGVKKAKGAIIVFLDDDAQINPDFLRVLQDFFSEHNADIVGGPQLTPPNDKGFARISGYALSSIFGSATASSRYKSNKLILDADERYLTSANLSVKKKIFDKVLFDPLLWPGEDTKFISDVRKKGFRVAYSPNIIIFHRRRPSIGSLAKQVFNYGKVRPLKEKFSETLKMPFFLVPAIFSLYLIFLFLIIITYPYILGNVISANKHLTGFATFLFIPLLAYLLLDIIFSFYESFNNLDLRGIFFLPFIFPLIHISYGFGILYGFLKKAKIYVPCFLDFLEYLFV